MPHNPLPFRKGHFDPRLTQCRCLSSSFLLQALDKYRVYFGVKLVGEPMSIIEKPAQFCSPKDAHATQVSARAGRVQ
uniref:Uncharacterized protein n=1 Tax=Anguilla anguilla TaxID=7936 RepID=A0A0E9UZ28_ANGAN